MIIKVVLVFFMSSVASFAAELRVKDLRAPEFDAQGRLIRTLKADAAVGPLDSPRLEHGVVDFFRPLSDKSVRLGTLSFDQAIYHRAAGIIDGQDLIHLDLPKGQITGKGFEYVLSNGHLKLFSNVVMEFPDAHVSGRAGDAILKEASEGKETLLSEARIKGHVVVTGLRTDKFKFDRAETDEAVYTESDGILILSSPVTAWMGAERTVVDAGQLKIYVGRQPNRTPSTP